MVSGVASGGWCNSMLSFRDSHGVDEARAEVQESMKVHLVFVMCAKREKARDGTRK